MHSLRTTILKAGSTFAELATKRGDFECWIEEKLNDGHADIDVVDAMEVKDLPDPQSVSRLIITGSPAMLSEQLPWMKHASAWVAAVVQQSNAPCLGICFGHQLLAHAMGGKVGPNPRGREIGTIDVDLSEHGSTHPLFSGLPRRLHVHASHSETVLLNAETGNPCGESSLDRNQVVVYGPKIVGLQFHPEFDEDIMRYYIEARQTSLVEEGFDPQRLIDQICPSDHGARILRNFHHIGSYSAL